MLGALLLLLGIFASQKDRYSAEMAELSRSIIGDENTARVESWYFALHDRADRLEYRVLGGSAAPFSESVETTEVVGFFRPDEFSVEEAPPQLVAIAPLPAEPAPPPPPARPAPMVIPETRLFLPRPEQNEGVWTTAGLPSTSPEDVLMAKTFIRPDPARPYASVGVLLLDKRRIRLHMTGGTEDPGGDLGVKGPGVIPVEHQASLLAAWNGGFRGPHGGYGMVADGKQYRPLRPNFASVAVMRDGTIAMGTWGRDLSWNSEIVAVRQNAVLLVEGCEVSPRTGEGNNTWGYVEVNSAEFITWRSAIGLTRDGDLLVAAGNSLSAQTLARALWAAGACYAMQLDINTPYVLTALFFPQADGSIKRTKFMDSMMDNPGRFLTKQTRDFMYATLDETNFVP